MSSTTSYHAVPFDENKPPAKLSSRSRKTLFLCVVFSILVFGSYRAVLSRFREPSSSLQLDSSTSVKTHGDQVSGSQTSLPQVPSDTPEMHNQGKYSVGYFVNWGIYGRKFPPSKIPVENLTHVLYAFADIRPDSGEVVLSDVWADKDIHYPGDSWNDVGNNLYGNLKAIYKLKQQNRHLKVLLSIGGWTYSPKFHPIVVNHALRTNFVQSAIRLLEDYGFDGLDVDYEYPSKESEARGYVDLLRELRTGLDHHAHTKGIDHRFLLTIAAPCGPSHYEKLHAREMNHYLDFWNMMAYDYSGSWDSVADHQANIFGGRIHASQAISWYNANGVPLSKMVLGIPLYGRSFMHTTGPGAPFNGVGQGTWEQGVYDYRALPLPGSYVFQDDKAIASWGYDYQKKEMVSFDNEQVGIWKGNWIRREGLRGSMFWELSGDKGDTREDMEGGYGKDPAPGNSLIAAVQNAMGPLDTSPNWLRYERSQFDNMRDGTI